MERRPRWIPWAVASVALLFAFVVFAVGMRTVSFDAEHIGHAWNGPGVFFGIFMMFLFFGFMRRMFWWGGGCYPYDRPSGRRAVSSGWRVHDRRRDCDSGD